MAKWTISQSIITFHHLYIFPITFMLCTSFYTELTLEAEIYQLEIDFDPQRIIKKKFCKKQKERYFTWEHPEGLGSSKIKAK